MGEDDAQAMDCPNCGRAIDEADTFCKHCGGRLDAPERPSRSATVDDMEAEYRSALVDKPDDPDARFNLGLANLYSGDYGAAADAFRSVIKLLPNESFGYEKLAVALAKLDRREEALQHAQQACRLDPESDRIQRLVKALGG